MSNSTTPSSSRSSSLLSSPPCTPPNLHQNTIDPSAKWLVQKFGGTSVGKFPTKIADIVANYIDQHRVAVVCSARSGSTKSLGTTNLLLQSASEALQRQPRDGNGTISGAATPITRSLFGAGYDDVPSTPASPHSLSRSSRSNSPPNPFAGFTPIQPSSTHTIEPQLPFNITVDVVRNEHLTAARAAVHDPELLQELEAEIERDCDWLRGFLFATKVVDEISPRSRDNIVGLGERLACKIMTAVLRDRGIDAEYISLEDIIPSDENDDLRMLDQDFYDRLAVLLEFRIHQCGPRVPVVTGFFGPVPGSLLHQVGRGYTDLLSAILAVGLQASELQIWKEVDGIFTADPRKVSTARVIPIISPDEAAELTYYGSEVVHPFTMEQVIRKRIPIRIKNVNNPTGGGTVIFPDPEVEEPDADPPEETVYSGTDILRPQQRLPTAVTFKENIVVLNVNSNRKSVSHGFLAGIFGTLDKFGVVVDLISTSEVHVSMAIEDGLAKKQLDRLVKELKNSGSVSVHGNMAILSLVGRHMHRMVGIAGRMFTTLSQGNVNIEMISQGASEINISCVIDAKDAVKALNLIHQSCLQIFPDGAKARGKWVHGCFKNGASRFWLHIPATPEGISFRVERSGKKGDLPTAYFPDLDLL